MSYHSLQIEFGDPVEYRSNQQGNGQGRSKVAPEPEERCISPSEERKTASPTGTETYKRPLSKKERELKEEQIKERLQYKKLRTDLLEKRRKEAMRAFKHANPKRKIVRKTQPESKNPTGAQKAVEIFQSIATGF